MSYVMFVLITSGQGAASFQYEFKDKTQCEKAITAMEKKFYKDKFSQRFRAYCQELRK